MRDQRKVLKIEKVETHKIVTDTHYVVELEGFEPDDRFIIKQHAALIYDTHDCSLTEGTYQKYYSRGYAVGFDVGYEWLDRGWNFVHYKEQGGYIPGGPYVSKKTDYAYNKGWLDGWKAGIDQYVIDKDYKIGTKSVHRY